MKQIILTMVAMWATVSASAQETIQNAYQKVIGNSTVELLSRSDYQDRIKTSLNKWNKPC